MGVELISAKKRHYRAMFFISLGILLILFAIQMHYDGWLIEIAYIVTQLFFLAGVIGWIGYAIKGRHHRAKATD